MPSQDAPQPQYEIIEVELRNPYLAALLAWFWPGAGHFYQRRYAKGTLFMVCVLTTYFFGLAMGGGHVVYASFQPDDRRWQYVCQVGAGLPALPAIVQNRRVRANKDPLFGGLMAPPPHVTPDAHDQLADWHLKYHGFFEMGTLYTMVAGLLNVLAIFDAYAGPMAVPIEEEKRGPPKGSRRRKSAEGKTATPETPDEPAD